MTRSYILFGSNQGDKKGLLEQACSLINKRCGMLVERSSEYMTEPWGFEAEEWFLNRLIIVETELEPEEMMRQLLDIETELGRVRHPEAEGYTSRTADLDILYYGSRIVLTDSLTIPHPRLHERRFALLPLCEMVPQLVHPAFDFTQTELLRRCHDFSEVRKIE